MKTFFEVNVFICDKTGRHYPQYEVYKDVNYYAESLEKVEKFISTFSLDRKIHNFSMVFAFHVKELPYEEKFLHGNVSERVYDSEWNLLDERLYPNFQNCGQYLGRTQDQIRFKEGDIVEVWYGDYVELAFVVNLPPTIEQVEETNNKLKARGSDLCMDYTDDCYTVMTSANFLTHEHVSSMFIFAPRFPIPKRTRERLEKAYAEYKRQLEKS